MEKSAANDAVHISRVLPGFEQYYKTQYPNSPGSKPKKIPKTNKEEQAPYSNLLSRTSLFGLVNRAKRKVLDWERLYSPEGTIVKYSGEQLNASDLDVLLAILLQVKDQTPGTAVAHTVSNWI